MVVQIFADAGQMMHRLLCRLPAIRSASPMPERCRITGEPMAPLDEQGFAARAGKKFLRLRE